MTAKTEKRAAGRVVYRRHPAGIHSRLEGGVAIPPSEGGRPEGPGDVNHLIRRMGGRVVAVALSQMYVIRCLHGLISAMPMPKGEDRNRGYAGAMNYHGIDIPMDQIEAFCRRNRIRGLSLFGSILRDDFGPDSDVDVLVEFEPGHVPGLIALNAMERELSGILGHKADLRTPRDLSRYFRDKVVQEAVVQYAA